MALPNITQTVTGVGKSTVIALDNMTNPFNIGVGVLISATATYSVEYTFDDVSADSFNPLTATWWTESQYGPTATTTKSVQFVIPCRGIRLNVAASTGTATIYIQQAGLR